MTDFAAVHISQPSRRTKPGLMAYLDLYRQRRALAAMDETQLLDLGLTRDDAIREANRAIWDAPQNWYR